MIRALDEIAKLPAPARKAFAGVFHPAYKTMIYGEHAIAEKEAFLVLISEAKTTVSTAAVEAKAKRQAEKEAAKAKKALERALGKRKSPAVESNNSARKRSRLDQDPFLM